MRKILVWDKGTRIFHWLLAVLCTFSLASGLQNDVDVMEWHMFSGYVLLTLLFFRIMTGFFGGDYGRFSQFSLNPKEIVEYLKGRKRYYGHNPLGSWMVVTMMAILLVQILSGFMTSDDVFLEGPWVALVDDEWISFAGETHSVNYYFLLGLIIFHLLAIAYYWKIKKENLVTPMFTGAKIVDKRVENQRAAIPMRYGRLIMFALISSGLSWFLVTFS